MTNQGIPEYYHCFMATIWATTCVSWHSELYYPHALADGNQA